MSQHATQIVYLTKGKTLKTNFLVHHCASTSSTQFSWHQYRAQKYKEATLLIHMYTQEIRGACYLQNNESD